MAHWREEIEMGNGANGRLGKNGGATESRRTLEEGGAEAPCTGQPVGADASVLERNEAVGMAGKNTQKRYEGGAMTSWERKEKDGRDGN